MGGTERPWPGSDAQGVGSVGATSFRALGGGAKGDAACFVFFHLGSDMSGSQRPTSGCQENTCACSHTYMYTFVQHVCVFCNQSQALSVNRTCGGRGRRQVRKQSDSEDLSSSLEFKPFALCNFILD